MSDETLREQMTNAWGGDAAWFTTGRKVADLVADHWLPEAAADERARIVWWLRAGIDGPGCADASYRQAIREMADAIEQHPERFADAPTGRSS